MISQIVICPNCRHKVDLVESRSVVPYRPTKPDAEIRERAEYRCPACHHWSTLRLNRFGMVAYPLLGLGVFVAWRTGLNHAAVIAFTICALLVILPKSRGLALTGRKDA